MNEAKKLCGCEAVIQLKDKWMAIQRVDSGADATQDTSKISMWDRFDKDGVPILTVEFDEQPATSQKFPEVKQNYIHTTFVDEDGINVFSSTNKDYDYYIYKDMGQGNVAFVRNGNLMQKFPYYKKWSNGFGKRDGKSILQFFRTLYSEYINESGRERYIMGYWHWDRSLGGANDYHNDIKHIVTDKGREKVIVNMTYGFKQTSRDSKLYKLAGMPTVLKWFPEGSNNTFDRFLVGFYYFWGYYFIPKDRQNKIDMETNKFFHRASNSLVGCPQVWCIEADVDGAAKSGSLNLLFRNFQVFLFEKFDRETYARTGLNIAKTWPDLKGGYIDAAANYNGKLLIFKGALVFECDNLKDRNSKGLKCTKDKSIANVFKGMNEVDAAMVTSNNEIWLFNWQKGANRYMKFKKNSTGYTALTELKYTWSKWQYLPKYIDAILSKGKTHYFFRNSYHYKVEEGDYGKKYPQLTMGNFFRCGDDSYNEVQWAANFKEFQSYMARFKPEPAEQPSEARVENRNYEEDDKKGFQWWWLLLILLLLLLLLLLLWCCLRRRKKSKFHVNRIHSYYLVCFCRQGSLSRKTPI